jgi:recombinational DNA repair ATPase RecF
MSNQVLKQRLYISSNKPFPLKLSNVDDGLGTGFRKTITLLFDIAYVSFIKEMKLDFPKFFVHDVLETIDEQNFYKIYKFINLNESQFIFAVLNEKIIKYDFINDSDIRLKLSQEQRLFKF